MSESFKIPLYFDGFEPLTGRIPPSPWRLVKWCVSPGSRVVPRTVIAEFEGNDMGVEHEIFDAGILHPLIQEGQEIQSGDQIAWLTVSVGEFRNFLTERATRGIDVRLTGEERLTLELARGSESLNEIVARLFRLGMETELGFKTSESRKSPPPSQP